MFPQRVYLCSVFPKAITHVRSGCKSCASHFSDNISLTYTLSFFLQNLRHVEVLGRIGTVVLYLYKISVARSIASLDYSSVCRTHNRSSVWGSIISPFVSFPGFLNRVKTPW